MIADATSSTRSVPLSVIASVLDRAGIEARIETSLSPEDILVRGISYDSRCVRRGDIFFALVGQTTDGHNFVEDAVGAGAAAVAVERGRIQEPLRSRLGAAVVEVPDTRAAMGIAAAALFGDPSRQSLKLAGVTGTNGKTTTTYMLASIFEAAGMPSGVIGTVGVRVGEKRIPAGRTTPESADLQRLLAEMVDAGMIACALEVSSHALSLGRIVGCHFKTAVFTNLTQDHLDFHASMEDYFEAKASLFSSDYTETAAINISDPWGRKLTSRVDLPLVTFGGKGDGADVYAEDVLLERDSTSFVLSLRRGESVERSKVKVPLAGGFVVWNALAAAAGALAMGLDLDAVAEGLRVVPPVPGRFERVSSGQDFLAVVDYAHTPDSVRSVLRSARALKADRASKVMVVVGCGGDRDRSKRPLMGRAALEEADFAVITSDNPRSEDPLSIIEEILSGVAEVADAQGRYAVEPDRKKAIELAVSMAEPGDVLVVAGKGHETGQIFADKVIPFDDREVLREAIEASLGAGDDLGERSW